MFRRAKEKIIVFNHNLDGATEQHRGIKKL